VRQKRALSSRQKNGWGGGVGRRGDNHARRYVATSVAVCVEESAWAHPLPDTDRAHGSLVAVKRRAYSHRCFARRLQREDIDGTVRSANDGVLRINFQTSLSAFRGGFGEVTRRGAAPAPETMEREHIQSGR